MNFSTTTAAPAAAPRAHSPHGRRAWLFYAGALLLALGLAARLLRFALNFPLWGDEAFVAVNFLDRSFSRMFDPLYYGQIVPLGYMWATLAVAKVAGLSEYALRSVSLVGALAALPLFWWFCRQHVGRRAAVFALGFLAGAYYPIRHANEVKPYSTDLLVALVVMIAAWAVYAHPRSLARWLALSVVAAAAVWCSYPAVFVCAAAGVLLLVQQVRGSRFRADSEEPRYRSRSTEARYRSNSETPARGDDDRGLGGGLSRGGGKVGILGVVILILLLGGSTIGMYIWYAAPHAEAAAGLTEEWAGKFPPLDRPWLLPVWFVLTHAGNMLAYPHGGKNGGSIVTLALVILGAVLLWRGGRRPLLWLLLGPLAFNLAAGALHKYPYGGTVRIMLYMAPAFCLLAGLGLAWTLRAFATSVARRRKRDPARTLRAANHVAVGVLAAFALGCIVRDVLEPYKKDANFNARRELRRLGERVQPEDQVIAFNSISETTPYAPYIAPWKGDGAQFIFYLKRYLPVETQYAPAPDAVKPQPQGRTWLLIYAGEEYRRKHDAYRARDAAYAATHGTFDEMRAAYVRATGDRLGAARHEIIALQAKHGFSFYQALEIYEYAGTGRGPASSASERGQ